LVTTHPETQLLKNLVYLGRFWSYAWHVYIKHS
jgi:hypothetical protein